MGLRTSSVGIAQTTRFKRTKLYYSSTSRQMTITRNSSRNYLQCTATPPATPFNNTSFLIQLQQRRELLQRSAPTFDQYGSMEGLIACCSFAATSTAPPPPGCHHRARHQPAPAFGGISAPAATSTSSQASNLSNSQITDPEPHHGKKPLQHSDPDEASQTCIDSESTHQHFWRSCDASTSSSSMRPRLKGAYSDEELQRNSHFNSKYFDAQCFCADSGSQTGSLVQS